MSVTISNWNKCVKCDIIIHSVDQQTHNEFCSSSSQDKNELPHAYIKKRVLYTFVKKPTGDVTNALPKSRNRFLLMHPSTMKFLNFVKGDLLLLKNENVCLILECWPSSKIEPNQFVMSSFSTLCHYKNIHFGISRYNGIIELANRIVINFNDYQSFMESRSFKDFIRATLDDLYFTQGLIINASYLGYPCSFSIDHIEDSSFVPIGESLEKFIHHMSDNFSGLKVNACEKNKFRRNPMHGNAFDYLEPITINYKRHTNYKSRNHSKKISNTRFFSLFQNTRVFIHHFQGCVTSKHVSFEDFGGLAEQIEEIKACFDDFYVKDSSHNRGILLIGPSGTGKTMMLNAIQSEYELPCFKLEKYFHFGNEASCKTAVRTTFKRASLSAPSIILIDEIDILCQKDRNSSAYDSVGFKANKLSTLIQNILYSEKVMVIATARSIRRVDACLRKPGVLEKEITFPVLSLDGQKEVGSKLFDKYKRKVRHRQISAIFDCIHGFTGGDMKRLFHRAILETVLKKEHHEGSDEPLLTWKDFDKIRKDISSSSMGEFKIEVPNVKWSDIGGMQNVKNAVTEMVDWPLKHVEQFEKFNITPSRGILLYGPPGCSKTMIAKALVSESHLNFISVKGPQLFNKYVGESEKCVSELFKKARLAAPCVIFFDEIDSLASVRGSTSGNSNVADRVLTQLLIEIDGIDVLKGVSIIAATNRPDMIDPSLLRPGRFDHMIYVPLPDVITRKEIFDIKLQKMPVASDVDVSYLVDATHQFTGAEIADLCREAAMLVITDDVRSSTSVITMNHFLQALHSVRPRTTKETIEFYENYANKFLL